MLENNLENNVDTFLFNVKLFNMTTRMMVQVDGETHKKVRVFAATTDRGTIGEVFSEGANLLMQLEGAKTIEAYFDTGGGGIKKKKIVLSK